MRLRNRDLKPYAYRPRETVTESDGTTYSGWIDDSAIIHANVQPAAGKMLVEMYGERLAYMKVAYSEKTNGAIEGDGVYIYAAANQEPDYKIIAIRPWGSHYVMDLEKVMP